MATALSIRSTNRLPASLSVPPLVRLQMTACRRARSAALFVGVATDADAVIALDRLDLIQGVEDQAALMKSLTLIVQSAAAEGEDRAAGGAAGPDGERKPDPARPAVGAAMDQTIGAVGMKPRCPTVVG